MRVRLSARTGLAILSAALFVSTTKAQVIVTDIAVDTAGNKSIGPSGDSSGGADAVNANSGVSISSTARFIAFSSFGGDLVASDTNGASDVFLRDRLAPSTVRISVDSSGSQANDDCYWPSLSTDGSVIAFYSEATNLVASDTNGVPDIFVRDLNTGLTSRVSVSSSGVEANGTSSYPSISGDGNLIVFVSDATNLVTGDTNGKSDIFLRNRSAGTTTRISVDSFGAQGNGVCYTPRISSNGQYVVFSSESTNLVTGDTNANADIFLRNLSSAVTTRISVDSSGAQSNNGSFQPVISSDGAVVAFESFASNLVSGDTNAVSDIFARVISAGTTERINVDASGAQANDESYRPSISGNGNFVSFHSMATNLVSSDVGGYWDVFVRDRGAGAIFRASTSVTYQQADWHSYFSELSSDGTAVVYTTGASNLFPGALGNWTVAVTEARATTDATWTNYETGFPGTNGIPGIASGADPIYGTTIGVSVGNSLGATTTGAFLVGYTGRANIPAAGGTILVANALITYVSIPNPVLTISVPLTDPSLYGLTLDMQMLEADSGAAHNISFTPGLELVLGDF